MNVNILIKKEWTWSDMYSFFPLIESQVYSWLHTREKKRMFCCASYSAVISAALSLWTKYQDSFRNCYLLERSDIKVLSMRGSTLKANTVCNTLFLFFFSPIYFISHCCFLKYIT